MDRIPPTDALNTYETRNRNLSAVFEAIREGDGVSRTEIGASMPFSLQTVTSISQELLAMGLIREGDRLVTPKGKPQTALHIVPGRGYAIGVQMRWNSVSICLVDLTYNIVEQTSVGVDAFAAEPYVREVVAHIGDFIAGHAGKDLWGIGISAPLPVASRGMDLSLQRAITWKDAEWFYNFWRAYSAQTLREELERELRLPTIILNNPQSAAIAEGLFAPLEAKMIYIMVGLSLGAAFVNRRAVNQELWRYAGEIGYVVYKDSPLSRLFSVSGLREHLGLTEPQGEYEALIEQAFAHDDSRLDTWFSESAERLRLIANFLENTMRPDGIVVGGFLPDEFLGELVKRVDPLPHSVVLDRHDPTRIMPRLAVARHSAGSISFGAAATIVSSRANSRFSALVGSRRRG